MNSNPLTFRLDRFEGPLDLLLHLIAKNKVSIYDIPIAQILDQYMEVLNQAQAMDMDVAGDFIAMAAQLVYIKSKMLLPRHEETPEDDPRAQLICVSMANLGAISLPNPLNHCKQKPLWNTGTQYLTLCAPHAICCGVPNAVSRLPLKSLPALSGGNQYPLGRKFCKS